MYILPLSESINIFVWAEIILEWWWLKRAAIKPRRRSPSWNQTTFSLNGDTCHKYCNQVECLLHDADIFTAQFGPMCDLYFKMKHVQESLRRTLMLPWQRIEKTLSDSRYDDFLCYYLMVSVNKYNEYITNYMYT